MLHGDADELVPEPAVRKLVDKLNTQKGVHVDYRIFPGPTMCSPSTPTRSPRQSRIIAARRSRAAPWRSPPTEAARLGPGHSPSGHRPGRAGRARKAQRQLASVRAARKPKHCASSASPSQPTVSTGSTGTPRAARKAAMMRRIVPPAAADQPASAGAGRRCRCDRRRGERHQRRRPVGRSERCKPLAWTERGKIQPIQRLRRRPGEIRMRQQLRSTPGSARPARASAPSRSNAPPVCRMTQSSSGPLPGPCRTRSEHHPGRSTSRWRRHRCSAPPAASADRAPGPRDKPAPAARPGRPPPRRRSGNRTRPACRSAAPASAASPICQVRRRSG